MSEERRPHAIHNLRKRMNRVSLTATAGGEALSEVSHLIGLALEGGNGEFWPLVRAQAIVEAVIGDQKLIAVEAATTENEPGHTQKRAKKPEQQKQGGLGI